LHQEYRVVNRAQRRAAASDKRRANKRANTIAVASDLVAGIAEQDKTLAGATLILPDGEMIRLDAATLKHGGQA
jgi:hypothetical protein